MTSIFPAPVLSARNYAQTTHSTSDTWTVILVGVDQGGEVTGLKHPKPGRN